MSVTTLTSLETIMDFIADEPSVVDFAKRDGCIPCRRLAPHYLLASASVDAASFGVVYLDELEQDDFIMVVGEFGLSATPTVYLFGAGGRIEIQERTAPLLIKEINSLII